MRPDDLLTWNRATPFAPYRILLNSGKTFDIRHPEMVRVGRSEVNIYSFASDVADPFERVEMVSLLLIESVEPSSAPSAA